MPTNKTNLAQDINAIRAVVRTFQSLQSIEQALVSALAAEQLQVEAETKLVSVKASVRAAEADVRVLLEKAATTTSRLQQDVDEARQRALTVGAEAEKKATDAARAIQAQASAEAALRKGQVDELVAQAKAAKAELAELQSQKNKLSSEVSALKARFAALVA